MKEWKFNSSIVLIIFIIMKPLFAATTENQENCGDVRMDLRGGSVSRLPILDQGSEGLCYSYTATQMVDAWRFSHRDEYVNRFTSPIYTGGLYVRDHKKKEILTQLDQEYMRAVENNKIEKLYGSIKNNIN